MEHLVLIIRMHRPRRGAEIHDLAGGDFEAEIGEGARDAGQAGEGGVFAVAGGQADEGLGIVGLDDFGPGEQAAADGVG